MFKEFRIGELFTKIETVKINGKANDFPKKPNNEFTIPLLTAGIDNQGLARYAKRDQCTTILSNVLSVSANGENSGAVFYQPHEFSVLQDAYVIRLIDQEIPSVQVGLYLATALNKAIRSNHNWMDKAGWNKIKNEKVTLPVTEHIIPDWNILRDIYIYIYQAWEKRCLI